MSRAARHDWLMRMAGPMFGAWRPFVASYRENPYPALRTLQREHPRYRHRLFDSWLFSRHEDVSALLVDPRLSAEREESELFQRFKPFAAAGERLRETFFRSLLMLDPPDHTRIRRLVQKAFTPRAVEALVPWMGELVDRQLAQAQPGRTIDLLESVAVPFPLTVICRMLGLPTDQLGRLSRWSNLLTELLDPLTMVAALRRSQSAIVELADYFDEQIDRRRQEPREDLLSALVQAEHEGDRLSNTELVSLVALLLAAGHETTANLLANAIIALERHPELRRRLVEDESVVEPAIEELLRYDGPVQLTDRMATEEVRVGDAAIRKGQMAILILAAANRDPEVYPDPDRLDFDRPAGRHLGLGHGVHFCLGAVLARAEAKVALPRILRALGDYRIDRQRLEWRRSIVLRGPTQLPLLPQPWSEVRRAG